MLYDVRGEIITLHITSQNYYYSNDNYIIHMRIAEKGAVEIII